MGMTRSEVMSRVRSKGTGLERKFVEICRSTGAHVRRADKVFGKPDFRIVGTDILIFVNSCFWHGCHWHCRMPGSRKGYWIPKIARNKRRQRDVIRALRRLGYRVLVVWEHTLKSRTVGVENQLNSIRRMSRQR